MEPRYRVVFSGELVPGKAIDAIALAFSARFRVKEQTARAVITGRGHQVLKRDLEPERAERYRAAFRKVGLVVAIEPQGLASELDPTAPAVDLEPPRPTVDGGESLTRISRELSTDVVSVTGAAVSSDVAPAPAAGRSSNPASRWSEHQLELEPIDGVAQGSGPGDGHTACPKCGAVAVSPVNGICEACGVVAERYLARLAAQAEQGDGGPDAGIDPYAPPRADLTPPGADVAGEGWLDDPRAVAPGRGWGWISGAWLLFKDQPVAWIGAFLLLGVFYVVLGLLPVLGTVIPTLIGPVLTAGLMIGAHEQASGGRFEIGHLFAGFSRRPGRLALLGLTYLGLVVALVLVSGLLLALILVTAGGGVSPEGFDPSALELEFGSSGVLLSLIPLLFFMFLGIPVVMAMLFAPILIALNDCSIPSALKLSFIACWRNILPFTVYGLAGMGLVILGALPLMLGLLVVVPVLTIAIYRAYRDIYYL